MDDKPLVSIGVPVYNGERFIRQALNSLLAQDYGNIELIVSDNASTDRTSEICHEYASKDRRVRYYRNDANLGAIRNFNRVFELSKGKYFMWAGSHDLWHPNYISRSVALLEDETDVVLVYSRTLLIDNEGNPLDLTPDQIDTRSMSLYQRYWLVLRISWCNMIYGVIRRDVILKTSGLRSIWGPDNVLLAELALWGPFANIKDALFYRRHRPVEEIEARIKRVSSDTEPQKAAKWGERSLGSLYNEMYFGHLQIIAHSNIKLSDKLLLINIALLSLITAHLGLLKNKIYICKY